jgi:hypothetical protein
MDRPAVQRPPGLVRRIFAGLAVVAFVGRLMIEPNLRNALWVVIIGTIATLIVIAPDGLRDGRVQAWERRHPLLVGVGASVFAGILAFLLVSLLLENDWLSAAISAALGIACGALMTFLGRRRQRVG